MELIREPGAAVRSRPYGRAQVLGLQSTTVSMATATSAEAQRRGQHID
ncbi:hypothetical protein [Variovorax sp. tm]